MFKHSIISLIIIMVALLLLAGCQYNYNVNVISNKGKTPDSKAKIFTKIYTDGLFTEGFNDPDSLWLKYEINVSFDHKIAVASSIDSLFLINPDIPIKHNVLLLGGYKKELDRRSKSFYKFDYNNLDIYVFHSKDKTKRQYIPVNNLKYSLLFKYRLIDKDGNSESFEDIQQINLKKQYQSTAPMLYGRPGF